MSHQYSKYSNALERNPEPVVRKRQARESEPPMMPNYNPLDRTPVTPTELIKAKQQPIFEQTSRNNGKFIVQVGDQNKPSQKTTAGQRSNDPPTSAANGKKEEQQQSSTLRTIASSRFMSPELKNGPAPAHRQERKYSNQISEISYSSRSIQSPSTSELGGQGKPIEAHQAHHSAQGKMGNTHLVSNQSAPLLPKKAPRFSEPANFSMDNWEENGNDSSQNT